MSYQILARAKRPQLFEELIDQDIIVSTLKQAIAQGKIPTGILLTGPRGVGKTTLARIIAKSLNCLKDTTPTTTPCNRCQNCSAITASQHIDVLEMDAASHTGVNDIREILSATSYAPVQGRYKVYIMDEVHMLSLNAFNALLKTLEEPPPSVVFILATTELGKVPKTIISRCQRYKLQRISTPALVSYLEKIAKEETITYEQKALERIAILADGSVRDALSLLEQGSLLEHNNITTKGLHAMVGTNHDASLATLLQLTLTGHKIEALKALENLVQQGIHPIHLLSRLLDFTHYAFKNALNLPLNQDLQQEVLDILLPLHTHPPALLLRTWQALYQSYKDLASLNTAHQAGLEMALLKLLYAQDLPLPEEIVKTSTSPAPSSPKQDTTPQNSRLFHSFEDVLTALQGEGHIGAARKLRQLATLVSFNSHDRHITLAIPTAHNLKEDLRTMQQTLKRLGHLEWTISLTNSPENTLPTKEPTPQQEQQIPQNDLPPVVQEAKKLFPTLQLKL